MKSKSNLFGSRFLVVLQVLLAVLEDYFTKVSELIFKTQGLLIDFVGDAVLASWNAPLEIQNHE